MLRIQVRRAAMDRNRLVVLSASLQLSLLAYGLLMYLTLSDANNLRRMLKLQYDAVNFSSSFWSTAGAEHCMRIQPLASPLRSYAVSAHHQVSEYRTRAHRLTVLYVIFDGGGPTSTQADDFGWSATDSTPHVHGFHSDTCILHGSPTRSHGSGETLAQPLRTHDIRGFTRVPPYGC
ncbi:hypothetical protein EI94DRAFT_1096930 [Lactarius quietus]|nr:hypothetical protein EI94DRAFT_1096930 [Lactarius quietus]